MVRCVLRRHPALAALALTVVLGACSSSGATTAPGKPVDLSTVTLRIGDQGQAIQTLFAASGQDKATPYHLSWFDFNDGPHMNAAFSAGRIDAGYMGDTPALLASAARAGVVIVATAKSVGTSESFYQLLARPGSGVKTVADLAHKKVAFTRGTALQGYLDELLDSAHLSERDITSVNVPLTTLASTLQSGSVDAAISYEPATTSYLSATPGAVTVPVPSIPVYLVELAATGALHDAGRRAALVDYVGRLAKAEAWAQANAPAWVQAYYVAHLHVPAAFGTRIFTATGQLRYQPVAGSGLRDHLARQQRLLTASGELPPGDSVSGLFDPGTTAAFDPVVAP